MSMQRGVKLIAAGILGFGFSALGLFLVRIAWESPLEISWKVAETCVVIFLFALFVYAASKGLRNESKAK